MIVNSFTKKTSLQKEVTFTQSLHHLTLLLQYWLVQGEKEKFASYKGQRAIVKQTPHVFGRSWQVLLNGRTITVDSDEIKMIYGSFELYGK